MIQLTLDDALDDDWYPPSALGDARAAIRRIGERGEALYYGEAHLAARWHLGFFERPPVGCVKCPATEATVGGLVNGIHAALNWEDIPAERLRINYAGQIFSCAPHLDYLPMCVSCHRKHDTWRKALPAEITRA